MIPQPFFIERHTEVLDSYVLSSLVSKSLPSTRQQNFESTSELGGLGAKGDIVFLSFLVFPCLAKGTDGNEDGLF